MPELPEVAALVGYLRARLVGRVVARVDVASIAVLKTYDPPVTALCGLTVTEVDRHGKFLDIDVDGVHLITHLARAGWLRWRVQQPTTLLKPGKGPIALRVHLDDGSGFDLTEAGTQKKLAVYVVRHPDEVPGITRLGVNPLADTFDPAALASLLREHGRMQLKRFLRDQSIMAGIGNAYSDEILNVAKVSPFKLAETVDESGVAALYDAITSTLDSAIARSAGLPAAELKDDKRTAMRVHGREGQPCPECGDVIRTVSFADSSLQYCATCQTGGKPLADRRMSRLLK